MSAKKQRPKKGGRVWGGTVKCDRCKRVQMNGHGGAGHAPISRERHPKALADLTFLLGDLSYLVPCACGSYTATYAFR